MNLFKINKARYNLWKSKVQCTTPGMSLWVGIESAKLELRFTDGSRRDFLKIAIKSFPEPITDCKCRNCRYYRMYIKV